jgi:hypothetical protein
MVLFFSRLTRAAVVWFSEITMASSWQGLVVFSPPWLIRRGHNFWHEEEQWF